MDDIISLNESMISLDYSDVLSQILHSLNYLNNMFFLFLVLAGLIFFWLIAWSIMRRFFEY